MVGHTRPSQATHVVLCKPRQPPPPPFPMPHPVCLCSSLVCAQCHETCAMMLVSQPCFLQLQQAGEDKEQRAAFARHAAGLAAERPDLGAGWMVAARGWYQLAEYFQAQVVRWGRGCSPSWLLRLKNARWLQAAVLESSVPVFTPNSPPRCVPSLQPTKPRRPCGGCP